MKIADNISTPHAPVNAVILSRDPAARDFLKGMSHDLHTPLHVILGLCQLLERDRKRTLDPIQRDAVERMERNARDLLQTVNHLLDCVRRGHFE